MISARPIRASALLKICAQPKPDCERVALIRAQEAWADA
jgi:hypothetical protein